MGITVSDANDEYPQFEEAGYEITLSESAPSNTRVVDVNAFDDDQAGVRVGDITTTIHIVLLSS